MHTSEEQREAVALRGLVQVMTTLHSARDLGVVLDAVASGVREVLRYDMAIIRVLDPATGTLRTTTVAGPDDAVASLTGGSVPLAELAGEFAIADRTGDVYFLPHERLPEDFVSTWVPEVEACDEPDAWHPMDALYVALHDPAGQLLGVLGVDLPLDRKRPDTAQRELLGLYADQAALALHRTKLLEQQQELLDSLIEGNRRREDMVAELAHDLKGPLSAISGHVEMGLEHVTDGDRDELHLQGIGRAAARIGDTLDELLASPAPGTPSPSSAAPEELDLLETLTEIVLVSTVVAERRGIELRITSHGPDFRVRGDERQLRRAADNLVTNALKYTPRGGLVDVVVDGTGPDLLVTCTDTGIGIPADEHALIFEDYGRATQARRYGIEGTGRGLPIARRIVESYGGSLGVASEPGTGSTFTMRLPARIRS
ncbi:GAF domain-containing sensor histidine kinase [Nocardioides donggukensis]|uniref:histidine kinase n=1 Tax=Nocardioides donggukensis TaxID=2774019 RepID=A0A927Q016_9ACTN|nr:GAF domain-containing sensor histidine kinase [Nocardioides donggukensis]MBD8871048.1 GAF domain-containing sensor histidine kinase [Nocardioides donggukensis]